MSDCTGAVDVSVDGARVMVMVVLVVVVMMVMVAIIVASVVVAAAGVHFMLLGRWMLRHVHHMQILLVVILRRSCLGHVLVDSGNDLWWSGYHGTHYRILRGLMLMGRDVRRWSSCRWRGLRSVVILLMGLARRGGGRRRSRRQILQLSGLGSVVVHVTWLERRCCLEVLMMDGRRVRREHLDRTGHQRLTGSCCDLNL